MSHPGYPFNRPDPGEPLTVILCHNDAHRKHVIDAFPYKHAYYALYGENPAGLRIDTLIWFRPENELELQAYRQNWYTRLKPNGREIQV
jgi:hypothetical protein